MNPPDVSRPPDNPDLWTLSQAAAFLGLLQRDLLVLIRTGALRCVRRGLRYRIHKAELDRYREEHGEASSRE
jgi:excisionase family DNA binding protein